MVTLISKGQLDVFVLRSFIKFNIALKNLIKLLSCHTKV